MYPRTKYEMTEEDLNTLLDSMKPEPVMLIGGSTGRSQQERANSAWARLGEKMGFDSTTVLPDGRGNRFFTAIPNETDAQKSDRLARKVIEERQEKIKKLESEIARLNQNLSEILLS